MTHITLNPGQIATELLPVDFGLVACDGKKRPYQRQWQKRPLDAAGIASEMRGRRCKAVGVLCGEPSGGLLFLDHDGDSCGPLIEELAGAPLAEALPTTFTVSSGKPGRAQYVYRIPKIFWGAIATHKIATGAVGPNGKPEQLEFRWNGHQSIVQGAHPETEGYRWQGTPEDIVEAPLWMITQMLVESPEQEAPALAQAPMSDVDWALSYLSAIPPTEDYDTWLHVGMALHSVSDTLLSAWDDWSRPAANYNEKDCERKWRSFRRSGRGIGTLGHLAKKHGWQSVSAVSAVSASVSTPADSSKPRRGKGSGIPVSKSADFEDKNLEESLVTDQEWRRFTETMKSLGGFDPFCWLPERLAKLARTDAERSAIDPMALWAYLLPATLSLMGNDACVNMSGEGGWREPNVVWSLLVGKSGSGKSRALDLVLNPLEKWNLTEFENWKMRVEDWQAQERAKSKNKADDDDRPEPKPKCRRYLIGLATPEGIVRRLADQENNGVLAARDEFAGFIKGLTQYTNGRGDGMEMLLETWGGKGLIVDRADEDKSFSVSSTRLNLAGGIQPGIFSKTFETNEDAQGTLGRFLVVQPAELEYRVYDGPVLLPGELTKIYRFIDATAWGVVVPTADAKKIIYDFTTEFKRTKPPTANAEAWQQKLHANTIRIALAIHALECYYDRAKNHSTLTADTVARAHTMARHYQRHFFHLMGGAANDGVNSILVKIQEQADSCPEGISTRDVVRGPAARLVERYARSEGIKPAEYARSLLERLTEEGWGTLEESIAGNGRKRSIYQAKKTYSKSADLLTRIEQPLEHQGLREFERVDTTADTADTTNDSGGDYSLKDSRSKVFEELVKDQSVVDTTPSEGVVTTATDPLGLGTQVLISYPLRQNPFDFPGYSRQGMITGWEHRPEGWLATVHSDGNVFQIWYDDLEVIK